MQRQVELTLWLIEAMLHNVPSIVVLYANKIRELKHAVKKSSNRNPSGDSENQKKRTHLPTTLDRPCVQPRNKGRSAAGKEQTQHENKHHSLQQIVTITVPVTSFENFDF